MVRGEIFNSATHLVGSLFALVGGALLVAAAGSSGDRWRLAGCSVYGASLLALYVVSTAYHSASGRAKQILRKLDHTSIYVLIAGTYTPFALVSLRGPLGFSLLVAVWTLAALGIAQEFVLRRRVELVSVSLYLVMGWLALAVLGPMSTALGWRTMAWLFLGGILYTLGVVFYIVDERLAHSHGVFHLFVLFGSVVHYLVILLRVR